MLSVTVVFVRVLVASVVFVRVFLVTGMLVYVVYVSLVVMLMNDFAMQDVILCLFMVAMFNVSFYHSRGRLIQYNPPETEHINSCYLIKLVDSIKT